MKDIQILLTNDDGIRSPGLWAAASALSEIGYVHVAAPRDQFSGAGRSLPTNSDGLITSQVITVNEQDWTVYAVGGTPAQTVLHAVLEILPRRPDLVVSGINYGENLGTGITVSGTVGAALEASAMGIPALAVSLETEPQFHLSYSETVDFSAAAVFTVHFARLLLGCQLPDDVNVLKLDIPSSATPETPWEITRISRQRYYEPIAPIRDSWAERGSVTYRMPQDEVRYDEGTDSYAIRVKRIVSVTPISLDLTSRVEFSDLDRCLRQK